jgi:hypothetical protein
VRAQSVAVDEVYASARGCADRAQLASRARSPRARTDALEAIEGAREDLAGVGATGRSAQRLAVTQLSAGDLKRSADRALVLQRFLELRTLAG